MLFSLLLASFTLSVPLAQVGPTPDQRPVVKSLADTADPGDDPRSLGALAPRAFNGSSFGVTVINPISLGWMLGGRPYTLDVLLTNLGSGFAENFLFQMPLKIGAAKRPMLMVFHKFGSKANDPYLNTTFPLECTKRNWFMLTALGATKKSFSSLESQANRNDVLDWIMATYGEQIDTDRIYGVGFSMGGGSVVNWAARHLDPAGLQLAALVDHTGGVALEDTWANEVPAIKDILKFWFGGPPGQFPFNYQRSSAMSYKPGTTQVDQLKSMGTNLVHLPIKMINADEDPLVYLVDQTKSFRDFMTSLGALIAYEEVDNDQHEWSSLNEKEACDFLEAFSLSTPLSGDTLADRDGAWFWFDIEQDFSGAFTPFTWSIDSGANKLSIKNTANLKRVGLDLATAPLDSAKTLTINLSASDFFADIVDIDGYTGPPSKVLRDGIFTSAWAWDQGIERLTLFEQDTQSHSWQIMP